MRPRAKPVPMAPLVAAVDAIMAAACGYARREGVHNCGSRQSCAPADWAELRVAVEQALVGAQAEVLQQVLERNDRAYEAEWLEWLEARQSRLCEEQRGPAPCRGCFDWMPCEGRYREQTTIGRFYRAAVEGLT